MDSLEVLISANVRFHPHINVIREGGRCGTASFATIEQASGFASAIETDYEVDDPTPDTEFNTWEVAYVRRTQM